MAMEQTVFEQIKSWSTCPFCLDAKDKITYTCFLLPELGSIESLQPCTYEQFTQCPVCGNGG